MQSSKCLRLQGISHSNCHLTSKVQQVRVRGQGQGLRLRVKVNGQGLGFRVRGQGYLRRKLFIGSQTIIVKMTTQEISFTYPQMHVHGRKLIILLTIFFNLVHLKINCSCFASPVFLSAYYKLIHLLFFIVKSSEKKQDS